MHYNIVTCQDWSSGAPEVTSDCEAGGRVSGLSLTSDTKTRGVTPPGDEIWAQKCHELDFQVRIATQDPG